MTDEEIVAGAWAIRDERWGYIWGQYGQVWTAEKQKAATRETTKKNGARWIGRRVSDCSGMIRRIYADHGLKITHSSKTQYTDYCQHRGRLVNGRRDDGAELMPGTGVFLSSADGHMHHVGLYVGGGVCIECKGTQWGCVESPIEHWDHWGEWRQVKYTGKVEIRKMQTVKKGSAGDYVKDLQERLTLLGYDCGAIDGKCGSKTVSAIMRFQQEEGLDADGVCGTQTWARIMELTGGQAPEKPDDPENKGTLIESLNEIMSDVYTVENKIRYLIEKERG